MLKAMDLSDAREPGWVTKLGNTYLQQTNTVGDKGIANQRSLLLLVQLRKTQANVHFGNMASAFRQPPGQ